MNLFTHAFGHRAALLGMTVLHWRRGTFLHSCFGTLEHCLSLTTRQFLEGTFSQTSSWTVLHSFSVTTSHLASVPVVHFFLHHRFTLVFKPCGANLIILHSALFFMLGLSGCPRNIDTLELRNVVAFFILNSATLDAGILSSLAFASKLGVTFLARNSLLDGSLSYLTLALLDFSTHSIGNCATLLPCDSLECGLGDLTANFLGYLATILLRAGS